MAFYSPSAGRPPAAPIPFGRLQSIDLIRGAVMILMAIDHVRVYAGLPADGQTPALFFTRWITHFCVPVFVFTAGTSAFLYGHLLDDKRRLAVYLFTRGLLLVILEFTVIRLGWTFNMNYNEFLLAGVIWMLGCCMMLMAALVRLKPLTVGVIGLIILTFQQLFRLVPDLLPVSARASFGRFWEFIYTSGLEGPSGIAILYVLVPWIGVMAAGYGFGLVLLIEPKRRQRICSWTGLSAIVIFLIVAGIIAYRQQNNVPFLFRLLNQKKYPASQLYLLMTLGPAIALLPFAEKAKGWFSRVLIVFGRVPLFYYLLHIPLIHFSALIVNFIRTGHLHQEWYGHAPFVFFDPAQRWSLATLYLVFVVDVVLLYFMCSWYARYKQTHPGKKWLKYL